MKILLMSIGTRGDVEPFLAVGEMLHKNGHSVDFAFPAQLGTLVPTNFTFHPFTEAFLNLLESEDGKLVIGGKAGFNKFRALLRLYKVGMDVNKTLVKEQFKIVERTNPDLIIYSGKCNYPVIWSMMQKGKTVLLSPVPFLIHKFPGKPHLGFKTLPIEFLHSISYSIANFAITKTIKSALKQIPVDFKTNDKSILNALKREKLAFTISPSLLKRPAELPSNVQILGYHERDKKMDWEIDEKLEKFLEVNKKVLLLTFGSMTNPYSVSNSKLIYEVLDELGIAVIVNKAAGGLVELDDYKDNPLFYFTSQIPYDWVLPKVFAAIHHGGSGTTHSTLKYGCATLILPHIIDQYGWSSLVSDLGAGPKGLAINRLTKRKLKPLIEELMNNANYKNRAIEIGKSMMAENLEKELYEFIIE